MTPHDKALEAALVAYCKATGINPEHRKVLMAATEQSCETYLTTLLDSPEMVEKIAMALHDSEFACEFNERDGHIQEGYIDQAKASIKAIKEEAGV